MFSHNNKKKKKKQRRKKKRKRKKKKEKKETFWSCWTYFVGGSRLFGAWPNPCLLHVIKTPR
jgi:hypothetical protein